MDEGEEILPEQECIDYLTSHTYLKNFSPHNILEDHNYKLPISNFICYCVGIIDGERVVQCIRILEKIPSEKITTMKIQWYMWKNHMWESVCFWVNSGVCLKKQFFLFQDKLNFFRSTYIYYPEMQIYHRLSYFLDYLDIKEVNPCGETIYNSTSKMHLYKHVIVKTPQKVFEKRKKEIKKGLTIFMKKNVDHYLQTHYPNLFHEIKSVLDK